MMNKEKKIMQEKFSFVNYFEYSIHVNHSFKVEVKK